MSAIFHRMPLKLADRTTERLALLDVARRVLKGAVGETAEC